MITSTNESMVDQLNWFSFFVCFCLVFKRFDKKAGTSEARMPLPEPNDLDKAGQLRFDELEENLKQLNKDLKGTLLAQLVLFETCFLCSTKFFGPP